MFADQIRHLRKSRSMTQVQFAKEFNVASGTIAMWETGKREPDFSTMQRIADFFGVTVDYLLGRGEKEKPTPVFESRPFVFSDEELVRRLCELPPEDVPRVRDFVQGLIAARKEPPSQKE